MTATHSIAEFDSLPDAAYIRLPAVATLFGCSPTTVWRRVKDGVIPPPKKLSPSITVWNVGEVRKTLRLVGTSK